MKITIENIMFEFNISLGDLTYLAEKNDIDLDVKNADVFPQESINKNAHYNKAISKQTFESLKKILTSEGYKNESNSILNNPSLYSDNPIIKTGVYESSRLNKTSTYENSSSDFTSTYDSQSNENMGLSKSKIHGLGIGNFLELKDIKYEIINIISEGTGEAVIYKIKNESGTIYALKLYHQFDNEKKEPNPETLERIKSIEHKDILKLVDFGVGSDKYKDKYCFEISEFAKGGDLLNVKNFKEKYTLDFIENNVIPEIYDGVKQLHLKKIFHCDLKPGNIFYLDEEQNDLIIGDYGSAKSKDLDLEGEVHHTSTVKGSEFYIAPELGANNGLVSEKSDYYSFGMILLHLFYPEIIAKGENFKILDRNETKKLSIRGISSKPLIDYNPKYARINKLIEGLTLYNPLTRWGAKELELWLNNQEESLEVKYFDTSNTVEIKLTKGRKIKTEKQLLEFIYNNPDWKLELLVDTTTREALLNWIYVKYDKDKKIEIEEAFKQTRNFDKNIDKGVRDSEKIDYTREAIIRSLNPEYPIIVKDKPHIITNGDINKNINNLINDLDVEWQILSVEKIRYIFFQLEFTLKQLLKTTDGNSSVVIQSILTKIYSSLGINSTEFTSNQSEIAKAIKQIDEETSQLKILKLFYAFDEQRGFKLGQDKRNTIEELGFYIVGNESTINTKKHFKVEKNAFLVKNSYTNYKDLGDKELVFEIFKEEAKSTIEYINLSFDKHRYYIINYKFYKSLTDYFKEKKIFVDFNLSSNNNEVFETRRDFLEKFSSVADEFLRNVKLKHNISSLPKSYENNIKTRISRDSWKQYFIVYQGQFLAAGCLLLIFISVGIPKLNEIYSPQESLPTQQTPNQSSTTINRYAYIKADPVGNIRSGTSTNHNIITSLSKGEKVYLIEQDFATSWYKVRYENNKIGYVSNTIIDFDNVETNKNINSNTTISSSLFIGNWDIDNGTSKYKFYKDNTGDYINSRGKLISFKWSYNNKYLKIILNSDNSVWNWEIKSFTDSQIYLHSSINKTNRILKKQ